MSHDGWYDDDLDFGEDEWEFVGLCDQCGKELHTACECDSDDDEPASPSVGAAPDTHREDGNR